MKKIGSIIDLARFSRRTDSKFAIRHNPFYDNACSIRDRFLLPLPICFRLLKLYTPQQIESTYSWWKDYPFKQKNNVGLMFWKLKDMYGINGRRSEMDKQEYKGRPGFVKEEFGN